MQIHTSLSAYPLAEAGNAARRIEETGFDAVTTQENRHNPFLSLAVASGTTSTLGLRTSIAIAFARSPMVSANLAWDLQGASSGRFVLGLGSQVKGHNVRRFSVPWSPPAPRLKEYVQAIQAIFDCWESGEKLDYQGEHYNFSLMTPNFTPEPLACKRPPIHIAAVGPGMLKVAGEVCDGVMLHPFSTPDYVRAVITPRLTAALTDSGRSRETFEISGGGFIATGPDDETVQKRFDWVRMRIGFYGSTPSYWPVFEQHDLKDLGIKLNDMSKRGKWDEMTQQISDDVVHLFCASGRHDQICDAIADHFGDTTDIISLDPDTPSDLLQDIRQL
jgi:probable F420-dependent oxidoreductase